jgi:transposase InsO family protein
MVHNYLQERSQKEREKAKDAKEDPIGQAKKEIQRVEIELRIARGKVRDERRREDGEWRVIRGLRKDGLIDNQKWQSKRNERKKMVAKRREEDKAWRERRNEIRVRKADLLNAIIQSLVAVLIVIDNCTRKIYRLPAFASGRHVTAQEIKEELKTILPESIRYLISDNGTQFIEKGFQAFMAQRGIIHIRISPHRPASNGIAERPIRTIKECLRQRSWNGIDRLCEVIDEVNAYYNDRPHQGIGGLSPNEYERRLECEE